MIDLNLEHQKLLALNAKRERRLFDCAGYVAPLNNLALRLKADPRVSEVRTHGGAESWGFGDREGAAFLFIDVSLKEHGWTDAAEIGREIAAAVGAAAAERGEQIVNQHPGEVQIDGSYNSYKVHRRVDLSVCNRSGHLFRLGCIVQMPQETKPRPVSFGTAPCSGSEALKAVAELTDADLDAIEEDTADWF